MGNVRTDQDGDLIGRGFARRLVRFLGRLTGWIYAYSPRWAQRCVTGVRMGKRAEGVVIVVLNELGEVLVLRHVHRRRGRNWGLPTGLVSRRDQHAEAGALRELLEETGLRPDRLHPLGVVSPGAPVRGFLEHWYRVEVPAASPVVEGVEITGHRWVPLDQAESWVANERQRRLMSSLVP